jgi:predicted MPP superfamily phosphohydrolase
MIRRHPIIVAFLLLLVAAGGVLAVLGWQEAHRDPVIRPGSIALSGWPAGHPPLTIALASDIHIGGGAMDGDRLARIVAQINAAAPDLIVLAGDFIDGHDAETARDNAPVLTQALRGLRAPLGTIAVLGNHDHDSDPARIAAALAAANIAVLDNAATQRGPLAIGVVGDAYSGNDDLPVTLRALARLSGPRLLVTHSPDIAPDMPADISLLLAGHTHCGQVVLPLVGALWVPSRFGDRYRCGIIREGARTVVTSAGLGTSLLPLRYRAPPDVWLLRLGAN